MDFEKEILEIEKKIEEVKTFAAEKKLDLQYEIDRLLGERNKKISEVYFRTAIC